ncbi:MULTISPECIES: hypothetical protein [unclassified Bacillus (in: firmicutes)]|uniref:hypothetical protein n=1 Tax=unclassified Bacillus (in: firmicutes) TaxID=185979 RepID=UPI001BEA4E41|nr:MULTISPECIES: hypothetical protein [unclassified Bacillus (in: firmicutes)]MBT2615494.1 hypothetical protein [Bacillus sp. ISL-78]MBT2632347.1 hypothetical protein [Bacillus sp. ISL-101]MBT2719039.1 hypothetical protein [Bacillus sp. ISL-57]
MAKDLKTMNTTKILDITSRENSLVQSKVRTVKSAVHLSKYYLEEAASRGYKDTKKQLFFGFPFLI